MKSGLMKKLLIFINLTLYLVVIGVWVIIPDETMLCYSVSGLTFFTTALYLFFYHGDFKNIYEGPLLKKLSAAVTTAFLVLCGLGLINFLAFKNPVQKDFSQFERNSLTTETVQVLEKAKGDITFHLFARKHQFSSFEKLLELYRFEKHELAIKLVDIDLNPASAQKYGLKDFPAVVVEGNQTFHVVEKVEEYTLTNAIERVFFKDQFKIGIYEGAYRGESILNEQGPEGFSDLIPLLQRGSRQISFIDLKDTKSTKYDVIMIMSPKRDLTAQELELLSAYHNDGGNLFVSLDPSLQKDQFPALRKWLEKRGLGVKNNFVIDLSLHVQGSNGTVPIVQQTNSTHNVLESFSGPVFFPFVSSIEKSTVTTGGRFVSLLQTSTEEASWAENTKDELLNNQYSFTEGVDQKGPITIAALWEPTESKKGRLFLIGNTTFLQNKYHGHGENLPFFLNAVAWLSFQNYAITFNRAGIQDKPVFLSSYHKNMAFYFSVLFFPLVMFGSGIFVYNRKQYI